MTLRLVIEHANHPQAVREMRHPRGELSIGRGADCSWQIEDPDMYVSRKHAVISGEPGRWYVTDASRGGLYIDGKDQPLGPGNTVSLEHGMRIRLGDVVIRIEVEAVAAAAEPRAAPTPQNHLQGDDFFSRPVTPPPVVARPQDLPQPFETARAAAASAPVASRPVPPPLFDDPFTLDALPTPRTPEPPPRPAPPQAASPHAAPAKSDDFSFGSFFDEPARTAPTRAAPPPADDWGLPPTPTPTRAAPAALDDWGLPPAIAAPEPVLAPSSQPAPPQPAPPDAEPPFGEPMFADVAGSALTPAEPDPFAFAPEPSQPTDPVPVESDLDRVRERVVAAPTEAVTPAALPAQVEVAVAPPPAPVSAIVAPPPTPIIAAKSPDQTPVQPTTDLHAAFFKGLGLDPATLPTQATPAEMEALGARFRLMVEGLLHMMRTRAKEKQNVRVAQTIIGKADVNPLKFLVTTEDARAALIAPRGAGYLAPDEAINGAFRDLADHQMRTWVAMQSALRRMIDRFDPAQIEREIEDTGMIQALLAGGRSAKLWQLYNDRYKDIARSAEDRFLGEVGADFRDAYEGNRRKTDDTTP